MSRSRINVSIDTELKIILVRYFGEIDGSEAAFNIVNSLIDLPEPWTYDSIMDMRRYESTVLWPEIEELATRWGLLAQGRDNGRLTAVITEDVLVAARLTSTQSLFPGRIIKLFNYFDDGLDWIKAERGYEPKALAS